MIQQATSWQELYLIRLVPPLVLAAPSVVPVLFFPRERTNWFFWGGIIGTHSLAVLIMFVLRNGLSPGTVTVVTIVAAMVAFGLVGLAVGRTLALAERELRPGEEGEMAKRKAVYMLVAMAYAIATHGILILESMRKVSELPTISASLPAL